MTTSERYLKRRLKVAFGNCYRMPAGLPDFLVFYKRQPILIEAKQRSGKVKDPQTLLNATQKNLQFDLDFIIAYVDNSNRYRYFYNGRLKLYKDVVELLDGRGPR